MKTKTLGYKQVYGEKEQRTTTHTVELKLKSPTLCTCELEMHTMCRSSAQDQITGQGNTSLV
jgi:hypothetical protein